MNERHNEPVTGLAAGVPFTALPPTVTGQGPAPLVLTWHMLDAPCTDAAFAAALPLRGVPAWRVHLGMPLCGARMINNSMDAVAELARKDPLMAYLAPFVWQAADEFPVALSALRQQLPVDTGPLGVVGGSLGGMVVLQILARSPIPIAAAAVVNPGVRVRSLLGLVKGPTRRPYPWNTESRTTADRLDFVARAEDIAARAPQPPLLVLSGELDFPMLRTDAAKLVAALGKRYAQPDDVQLTTVPDLAHPLAEPPGPAASSTAPHRQSSGRHDHPVVPASPHDSPSHQPRCAHISGTLMPRGVTDPCIHAVRARLLIECVVMALMQGCLLSGRGVSGRVGVAL